MILLAQVYQIISQIIKINELSSYYMDIQLMRKNSEENLYTIEKPSPYLIRKRKYQKFLKLKEKENNLNNSPAMKAR
jgi:hypothetical protein